MMPYVIPHRLVSSGLLNRGSCKLYSFCLNDGSNGTITLYDDTSATGTPKMILTVKPADPPVTEFNHGVNFTNGIYVVLTTITDVTFMLGQLE